jgi:PAS domain S-box-containing protein
MEVDRTEDRRAYLSLSWGGWGCVHARVAILSIVLCVLSGQSARAVDPHEKNVLLVFGSLYAHYEPSLNLIESSVRAHYSEQVNFSVAYLDYQKLEEESYRESLAETLRRGYNEVTPDLIVVASIHSVQFLIQYRDKIFPGVPIVFTELSADELQGQKLLPGMTGLMVSLGLRETIDLALRLHPDTTAFALIADAPGPPEKYWVARIHSELLRHQDKVKEIDVIGPPSREMLEKVEALPSHTVALFEVAPRSSSDPAVTAYDVLKAASQHVPTYSPLHTLCLNYGCIGGAYSDWQKQAQRTGEIAARVLSGERPESIPIVEDADFQVQVDWQALHRWHIPESALPAGSVILNRPPSFWESYRNYMIAAIVVTGVLVLLMIGLLWQRARKRKAEALLQESEQRFKVMADTTPALIWMCDSKGQVTYLNDRRVAFTGPDPNAGYGDTWVAYIHPDDQKNVQDAVAQALTTRQAFSKEYRLRRTDGLYRWMLDVATPRVNGDGSFAGFIGSAIDITDQKLAQQALEKVSGQMIEAQEKERRRIARDLHDDICQRLALLSMEIDQAKRVSGDASETTKDRLQEIRKHCSEITGDVQSLSHQLHSSKLESLGIEAAIRGFCREFAKQHEVNVEFTCRNVPRHLPKEISLCLFRVAQEALQNAVKYSGVSEFTVELLSMEDEIHLAVADEGAGFDLEEAKRKQGLGLMSMHERVHLAHGVLSVESKPGRGTQVLAVVPLDGRSLKEVEETAGMTGIS